MHFLEHYISWPVIKRYLIFNVTCQLDEEEDVGSYWMTLRKGEDTLN
jgi:hypothetical protein